MTFKMASNLSRNDFFDQKSSIYDGFKRLNNTTTYEYFVENHLLSNQPCLFDRNVMDAAQWKCKHWKNKNESESCVNLDMKKLIKLFGGAIVPVAQCSKQEFDAHPKIEMNLSDYLGYLEADPTDGNFYLKDWHFQREFPTADVYQTPIYFRSDWLNEYCDSRRADDYRFLYLGPEGSWTPFHADVFRSYSWSANVVGKKRWIVLPPGEEDKLRDPRGRLPFDVRPALIGREDIAWYDVTQEEGEIIFIPSGWHHQVHNLEMTLSINHNWYNGCNILYCWRHLVAGLADIEKEIEEWRESMGQEEWTQHCQMMLKSLSGMDYNDFLQMLTTIAENRLNPGLTESKPSDENSELTNRENTAQRERSTSKGVPSNKNLTPTPLNQNKSSDANPWMNVKFDLEKIRLALETMLQDGNFLLLKPTAQKAETLLTRVSEALDIL